MTDYKSSLQASLGLFNLVCPLLSPEVLEREESVTNLIVHLDELLRFFLLDQVLWELLHWSGDSVEKMARPGDAARNSWQVSDNWWLTLLSLILVLDVMDFKSIVMEQNVVL